MLPPPVELTSEIREAVQHDVQSDSLGEGAPRLTVEGLTIALPNGADRTFALDRISLSLRANEIVCVVGESGAGKTVLARSVMRLLPPGLSVASGRIILCGEDLTRSTEARMRQIRGRHIGMIFQEPMSALNPLMTVGRQVTEMITAHRAAATSTCCREQALDMFVRVSLERPERIFQSYPHELSGGQRQRVMIAMALALNPHVLIADEPTSSLDVTSQARIIALIKELQAKMETSVMFITHDFGVVAEMADRVAVLNAGRLAEVGATREVLTKPNHPRTQALIAAVPEMIVRPSTSAPRNAVVALRTVSLSKTYGARSSLLWRSTGEVPAIVDVNITIHRGRILGIVGESGSGKSTLARCIAQLLRADSGQVWLGQEDLCSMGPKQLRSRRKKMQMVFQDPFASLNPRQRVVDTVAQGPMVQGTPRGEAMANALQLLRLVGLRENAADRFPHEFSGGQRQRICIARSLALSPELLIADEPVSALDASTQAQVLKLLQDVRDKFRLSMLFITHDLRIASQVCDDVAVMRGGRIVEQGPTAIVFSDPKHEYTRELIKALPGRT